MYSRLPKNGWVVQSDVGVDQGRELYLCCRSHRNFGSKLICSAIASESVNAGSCRRDRCRRISVSLTVLTLRRDWAMFCERSCFFVRCS